MALAAAEYSALAGKTRAMYGKLLTSEDYSELMQQRSVGDVAAILKYRTHYRGVLSGINECDIHRIQLENILKKSLLDDFRKLFCFSRGKRKAFLKIAYMKHEVESIKRLFRVLEMEGTTTLAKEALLFLSKYDTLNITRLSKVHSSQEFIANLKGTGYYHILRPFLAEDKSHNLFHIEMSLDRYYMNLVISKKKSLLQGMDAKVVDYSVGTEIDVMNLLWIYRGRAIYNLDRSVILGYLVPHGYSLSMDLIYELVDARGSEAFKQIVAKTKYAELFSSDKHMFFELNYSEYMYTMHKRFLRKYGFTISSALSYLHLKEFELSNIISIIEGIRYQLPEDEIRRYIVGFQDIHR